MQSSFYVTLSSQLALDKRMATIASNIANASSIGYRATGVSFQTVLSKNGATDVAFSSAGDDFISRSQGAVSKTGNPFDVAVLGEGWLAIQTPNGVAYTRDGRLQVTESGDLQTILGFPVLDAGGSQITLDPSAGPPTISRDGMINQGARQAGALGLFEIDDSATLARGENSSIFPSTPANPILDFTRNGVIQGSIESANVNPLQEMTKLILASRNFDSMSAASDMMDSSQRNAVKTLGGG